MQFAALIALHDFGGASNARDGRIRSGGKAGIRNVFDEDPPISQSVFANSFDPQYDVPGRFWYMQYSQKF